MNHYYTRLSFEKLENFDMQKSRLSSFVLVRNSLITALTMQQHFNTMVDDDDDDDDLMEEEEEYDNNMMLFDKVEEEQQVWLDSCFNELDQVYNHEEDSDEEEDNMPTSPQDDDVPFYNQLKKKPTFYINEEDEEDEDGLICYDIPFLSLVDGQSSL